MENELSQYGDTPYIARGWGMILPWPVTADDASDVFNVSVVFCSHITVDSRYLDFDYLE